MKKERMSESFLCKRIATDLIQSTCLPIPFLDAVEGGLAGEIKGEQDGDGVVAYKRQHAHEFLLA